MFFASSDFICRYITSIPSKYDVGMIKYYSATLKYISRPLHSDAITLLLKYYENGSLNKATMAYQIRYWDKRICDMVLDRSDPYLYCRTFIHILHGDIIVPPAQELDLIRRYADAITCIHNISDEALVLHEFTHQL